MTNPETAPTQWSFAKRLGFRFLFSYFLLYYAPFPLDLLPYTGGVWSLWNKAWEQLVIWTGAHILHLATPVEYQPTGSGDTMHDWVLVFLSLLIAVFAAGLWSVLDRHRKDYARLAGWSRVYLRYALASVMLGYGFSKVFDLQFSPPTGMRLTETYGESSPMGLAWTFMGASIAYTVFAGVMECLGGLLLFFRRTATLGALVTAAVMTNVVMMNFCYDIPVKLYSTHLAATALVLLAPVASQLMDVFILHRGVPPERTQAPSWTGLRKWSRWSLKALLVGYLFFTNISSNLQAKKTYGAPPGPMEGTYEVVSFTRNGAEVPPLLTDKTRWRWAMIYPEFLSIRAMNGERLPYTLTKDSAHGIWTLAGVNKAKPDPTQAPAGSLHVTAPDPQHLLMEGTLEGSAVCIRLQKKTDKDFPLMNRGFHWINEFPYNR